MKKNNEIQDEELPFRRSPINWCILRTKYATCMITANDIPFEVLTCALINGVTHTGNLMQVSVYARWVCRNGKLH